jgi:hypothetical protein
MLVLLHPTHHGLCIFRLIITIVSCMGKAKHVGDIPKMQGWTWLPPCHRPLILEMPPP